MAHRCEDGENTPEFRAIVSCTEDLNNLIQTDYHSLASKLLGKGLIGEDVEKRTRLNIIETEKAAAILDCVRKRVKSNEQLFDAFLEALQTPYYDTVRKKLEDRRTKYSMTISKEIEEFRERFSELQKSILQEVDQREGVPQISPLNPPPHNMVSYITSILKPGIATIFTRNHGDFLDYYLLHFLISEFGSSELKKRMEKYKDDLLEFRKRTRVVQFFEELPERPVSPGFKKLIEMVDENPETCTLEDLNKLRTMEGRLEKGKGRSLSEVALLLWWGTSCPECIKVTWLLPSELLENFKELFERCVVKGTPFKDSKIISVELGGHAFMSKKRALFKAIREKDVCKVDRLLERDEREYEINESDEEGKSCLVVASELGHSEIVALLLEQPEVDLNRRVMKSKNWTALFFAHHGGHQNVVKLLEEYGADETITDTGKRTASEVTTIKENAAKKQRGVSGWTSTMKSIGSVFKKGYFTLIGKKLIAYSETGNYDALEELIRKKDVDLDMSDGTNREWTALMWACANGHYRCAELLVSKGASVNIVSRKNNSWTALLLACCRNYLRITNLLLKYKADPNLTLDTNYSALLYISDVGYIEIARSLLKHGADPNEATDQDGTTPLIVAITYEQVDLVKLYLEFQADPNIAAHRGWTALMEATRINNEDLVKILLDNGAEKEMVMEKAGRTTGEAALHVACYKGHSKIVEVLVETGADVNQKNAAGFTPLMLAAKRDKSEAVTALLKSKCIKVKVDLLHEETQFPAVIMAAKEGNVNICKLLLQHGARPDVHDFSIVDVAPSSKKKLIAKLVNDYKPEMRSQHVCSEVKVQSDLGRELSASEKHASQQELVDKSKVLQPPEETVTTSDLPAPPEHRNSGDHGVLPTEKELQCVAESAKSITLAADLPVAEGSLDIVKGPQLADMKDEKHASQDVKKMTSSEEDKNSDEEYEDASPLFYPEEKHNVFSSMANETMVETESAYKKDRRVSELSLDERKKILDRIWTTHVSSLEKYLADENDTENDTDTTNKKGLQPPRTPHQEYITDS